VALCGCERPDMPATDGEACGQSTVWLIPPRSILRIRRLGCGAMINSIRVGVGEPRDDSDDESCHEAEKYEPDDQRAAGNGQRDSITDLAIAPEPAVHEPPEDLRLVGAPHCATFESLSDEAAKSASDCSQHSCKSLSRAATPTRASRVRWDSVRVRGPKAEAAPLRIHAAS